MLARNPDARASQRWHSLLTWGSDGRLYSSGPTGNGLAYWDSVSGWTDTGLVTPETIRAPWIEANGRFYTRSGNDNIVSVAKNGTDMVTYDITAYGRQPTPYLLHSNGRLYGLTIGHNAANPQKKPALFSMVPSADPAQIDYRIEHDFGGPDFAGGTAFDRMVSNVEAMLEDPVSGIIYVMVQSGGNPNDAGTIWSFDPDNAAGDGYKLVYSVERLVGFDENGVQRKNMTGYYARGMGFGPDGNLYGVMNDGPHWANGTIFRIDLATGDFDTVYEFLLNEHQNAFPNALITGGDGQLYGWTRKSGPHQGSLFRFTPGDEVDAKTTLNFPDTVGQGYTTQVTWATQFLYNCIPSTSNPEHQALWSGADFPRTNLEGIELTFATQGIWNYTLTCNDKADGTGSPINTSATVNVVPATPEPGSAGNGDGGGSFTPVLALLPLWGAGWLLRRRRRAVH